MSEIKNSSAPITSVVFLDGAREEFSALLPGLEALQFFCTIEEDRRNLQPTIDDLPIFTKEVLLLSGDIVCVTFMTRVRSLSAKGIFRSDEEREEFIELIILEVRRKSPPENISKDVKARARAAILALERSGFFGAGIQLAKEAIKKYMGV